MGDVAEPCAVPDDVEVVARAKSPAKAGVAAECVGDVVELDEGAQRQVGVQGQSTFELPETFDVIALFSAAEVFVGVQAGFNFAVHRGPIQRVGLVIEVAVVVAAEAGDIDELELALGAGDKIADVALEVVSPVRIGDGRHDGEWGGEGFVILVCRDLEGVSGVGGEVNGRKLDLL